MSRVIGIDVGGTAIKAARFAGSRMEERRTIPTPSAEVVGAVTELARDLLAPDVDGVGVAVPGVVVDGVVQYSTNVAWADVPLRETLEDALNVPVVVANDVNAAAVGVGGDLLYVALGTGIGGALVVGGELIEGARGLAGEIGHVPVWPDGEPCACGQRGCLETYASASSVVRRYGGVTSAAELVARLDGDPAAREVWDAATTALGIALASATLLLDPPRIVLGGGLAGAGAALVEPVRAELARRLAWRPAPPVELAADPADAGIRGAAVLARAVRESA
jgi:glucokinase